jgi:hypothetical protein
MQNVEQAIRERAYQMWIDGGCQDGHAETHWLAAQREFLSASLGEIGRVSVSEVAQVIDKPKKKASRKKQRAA